MSALAMHFDDLPSAQQPPQMQPGMPQARQWGPWLWGGTALVAVLGAAWLFLSLGGAERIREVHIEGYFERVPAAEVEAVIEPFLDIALADLDLDAAKAAVERLPWVSHARVERVWPDRLRVRVWERQPFARWGDDQLLDSESRRFKPAAPLPEGLPQLSGAEGGEAQIARMFRELSVQLADGPFAIKGLARDARGEWTARTVSGAELRFGRSDPSAALEVLKGPARKSLEPRIEEVAYVDLRYSNGFSVGWQPPPPAGSNGK